ncbi:MAG: LysM peptidoglycan-binding domain-containing protein [Planctomycetota bacterium]|jgi:nucleoid-associated protein YgaU
MGSFEKLVVLTVIFLSAVVLTISLNHQTDAKEGASPADVRREQQSNLPSTPVVDLDEERSAQVEPPVTEGAPENDAPENNALLSAEARPLEDSAGADAETLQNDNPFRPGANAAGATPQPPVSTVEVTQGRPQTVEGKLITLEGLTASPIAGVFVYVPVEGDTWTKLSQRFYGSTRFQRSMMQDNEGYPLEPGRGIYVYADPSVVDERDAFEAQPARDLPGSSRPSGSGDVGEVVESDSDQGATHRSYTVQDGDTLSSIAYDHYGRASLWRRIWDANLDVLPNPDDLRVDQVLRIP